MVAKRLALVLSAALTLSAVAGAQIKLKQLPDGARKVVELQSKTAKLVNITVQPVSGTALYHADFSLNGRHRGITLDGAGDVVEIRDAVAFVAVTPLAQAAIKRAAGKGHVLGVETVIRGGTLLGYYALVQKTPAAPRSQVTVTTGGLPMTF